MLFYTIKLFNENYINRLKQKDFVVESLFTDGFVYEEVAVALRTHDITDVVNHSIAKEKYQARYQHITDELLSELEQEHVIGFLDVNGKNERGESVSIPNSMFLKGKGRILYESRELFYTSFEKNVQLRIDILRNWFLVLLALATLAFGIIQYLNGNKKDQSLGVLQNKIKRIEFHVDSLKRNSHNFNSEISSQIKDVKDSLNVVMKLKSGFKKPHVNSKKAKI